MEQTQQPFNASADAIKAAKIEAETELFKAESRKRLAEIDKMIHDSIEDRKKSEREYERQRIESERAIERYRVESAKEQERYRVESAKEQERYRVESAKIAAETAKLYKESQWYPAIAMAAVIGATATIVKMFF